MSFIHEDFLLSTDAARRLYHEFAADSPILDYHTHLPPADIASDRRFADLFEIWLEGDHYKWRAMRANGVDQRYCTGDASPKEKFLAWAGTTPNTLRNPLYHWTHLELNRYFGIDELLSPATAESIWDRSKEMLAGDDFTVSGIFKKFDVRCVCTTDDPTDDLELHREIAERGDRTKVFPTFRPDAALRIDQTENFRAWVNRLESVSGVSIKTFDQFLEALESRHAAFHEAGCRLSDHGLTRCFATPCTDSEAGAIFAEARSGKTLSPEQRDQFATDLMLHFGRWDAARGWTKQLHLGALRNNNARLFDQLGPDVGCDSIGDWSQAEPLAWYMSHLAAEDSLPKMILYNLNPADNYVMATMAGNFQSSEVRGKIQWGSGWWHLDQWEAMEWQMNALSNVGLLAHFVGMLTDSRSFMSFPRHEYFRRCLCNLLGSDVESGAVPNEDELLAPLIQNICYGNARDYLGLGVE
ncbi:glucuronate isomerase [Pirellulales bacterium]|nr:glucuronate isomerase [Pirellulales bacterium]